LNAVRRALGLSVALLLALGLLVARANHDPRTRAALLAPVTTAKPSTTTTAAPSTTTTVAPVTTTTLFPPDPPVAAGDPAGVAAQLTAAETALRNPAISSDDTARAGHLTQVAYLALLNHPDWQAAAIAAVPDPLKGVVQANLKAGTELRLLAPKPRDKLPTNWAIDAPIPAAELLAIYREGEAATGVPWQYLAAINLVETRMGRIHGLSSAGAQGPMQFMPETWARFGQGDINNPRDAVLAAARYLEYNGAPQTLDTAIWNYNRSWHYVAAVNTYAEQMRADEAAFRGYYHWQVYYRTVAGDQLLPEGWRS
jgi:membrane-bound lytic murein transglycosylase B